MLLICTEQTNSPDCHSAAATWHPVIGTLDSNVKLEIPMMIHSLILLGIGGMLLGVSVRAYVKVIRSFRSLLEENGHDPILVNNLSPFVDSITAIIRVIEGRETIGLLKTLDKKLVHQIINSSGVEANKPC